MTTYVFENAEVQKTGRVADRKLKSGKIDHLVEITPVDENVGKWKKWVREAELFEVKDKE
jgi:hypothetical protein